MKIVTENEKSRVNEERTKMAALMETGTPNIDINKQMYW